MQIYAIIFDAWCHIDAATQDDAAAICWWYLPLRRGDMLRCHMLRFAMLILCLMPCRFDDMRRDADAPFWFSLRFLHMLFRRYLLLLMLICLLIMLMFRCWCLLIRHYYTLVMLILMPLRCCLILLLMISLFSFAMFDIYIIFAYDTPLFYALIWCLLLFSPLFADAAIFFFSLFFSLFSFLSMPFHWCWYWLFAAFLFFAYIDDDAYATMLAFTRWCLILMTRDAAAAMRATFASVVYALRRAVDGYAAAIDATMLIIHYWLLLSDWYYYYVIY